MTKLFFILLMVAPSLAFARGDWFEKGNGGYAVVCPQQAPRTLDLVEAVNPHNPEKWILDTSHVGSLEERVHYLLGKIEKHNPARAALYQEWFNNFFQEAQMSEDMSLYPIADLGRVEIPKGCQVEQVVYQRQPSALSQARYTLNADLWTKLSVMDQAALVLHELAYRELALPPSGHRTSEPSRKFVGWVNSTSIDSVTTEDYVLQLQGLFFVQAEYMGYPILLNYKDEASEKWIALPAYKGLGATAPTFTVTLDATPQDSVFYFGETMISADCSKSPKLKTLGMMQTQNGRVQRIDPLEPNRVVENCKGDYFTPQNALKVKGDVWVFDDDGSLSAVLGYFKRSTELSFPLEYDIFTFIVGKTDFPVAGEFLFAKNQLQSATFNAQACRNGIIVQLQTDAPTNATITFTAEKMKEEIQELEACKK